MNPLNNVLSAVRPWLLIGLFPVLLTACGEAAKHPPAPALPPITAALGSAEKVDAPERLELAGSVEAEQVAAVSSRVMAPVVAVLVERGEAVKKGQTLVSIDATAAAGQVAQAQGAETQAQAALVMAAKNLERFEALAAQNAASAVELDAARMQHEQARGAVAQAQGAVAAAAAVARESKVVAPFDGRVAQRLVEVGDLAAPGRPLFLIESAAGRRVSLAVPESLAANLAVGSPLPVRLDARPELGEIIGRVVEISAGPDPRSHAYTVKVALEAGNAIQAVEAPTGAAARGWIVGRSRASVEVPADSLIVQGGLTLVVVRDEQGLARSRVVRTGATRFGGRIEVLSGLSGGETLLLGLSVAPPDGSPVEAKLAEEAL